MTLRLHRRFAAVFAAGLLVSSVAAAVQPDEPLPEVASVPRDVARGVDAGRLDGDARVERAILVLPVRDPGGLSRVLAAQQDPAAPEFQRWLSPAEFADRFGAPETDVAALRAYLEANGIAVEDVPGGRTALVFSGRAADVERAFATELHEIFVDGAVRVANVLPARLPRGLAKRTAGLLSLNSFPRRRPLARRPAVVLAPGQNKIGPADLSAIYDMGPLAAAGITGAGRNVAILARTNINLGDPAFFRQYFGLPAKDPVVVVNGDDPGRNEDEIEALVDVQWSGATAPGATITLVVSKDTDASSGVDLSALYAVSNNVADILSLSYGACEDDFAATDTVFYTNVWAQAAVQGTSVFVASGDQGAAGCDPATASAGSRRFVNGLGSSPYATCVGGTQLASFSSSQYWNATSDPLTKRSAKGYIPESVWNESGAAGGSGLWASGGGLSVLFARPPWQNVTGIPAGDGRSVPDISLVAGDNFPYLYVQGHAGGTTGLGEVEGTSISAPAMAGITALLSQRAGTRLGSLNPLLYALGATQYGTSGAVASGAGPFHDVTAGSNTVPGVTGFDAGPGFDVPSGLGSPDVSALSAALPSPSAAGADLALSASPALLAVAPGSSGAVTIALVQPAAASVSADAVATLAVAGLPASLTASFSPSKLNDVTTGVVSRAEEAILTLSAASSAAAGTYPFTLSATSGAVVRRVALSVSVGTQTPVPPSGPGLQAPVVLDVFGAGGSHYTSDLVAVNRGNTDATLLLRFAQTPAPAAPGPTIARSLGAGRQLYVPDVIAFLNANGYALPPDGSAKLGTLFATYAGATDPLSVFVGSRTSTPNPNAAVGGAFGTFSAGVSTGGASSGDAWIYGLRETAAYRTNLAVVHAPGTSSGIAAGPVALEIQLYDGDSGAPVGAPLARTLQPAEFFQYNSILKLTPTGVTNGYARVRLASGSDRFIAYGVVNDGPSTGGGTSDGSFLPANATEGLVPIVLDLPGATHYTSDLTLTNPTSAPVTVTLTYTASSAFSGAGSGTRTTTLATRQQLVTSNAIAFLRGLGLPIPSTGNQGGTLLVSGAPALARTSNPNPDATVGGTFGLAYPAVGAASRAKGEAWVYGLRQDADARTNLAIADARAGNGAGVEYVVDVFDSDSGATSPVLTKRVTLAGGQWTQFNTILAEAGIAHGYARVKPSSGLSDFVIYGVVNDGPTAGSRTSDGSYVPMVVVN